MYDSSYYWKLTLFSQVEQWAHSVLDVGILSFSTDSIAIVSLEKGSVGKFFVVRTVHIVDSFY